jgi:hypothetical protein
VGGPRGQSAPRRTVGGSEKEPRAAHSGLQGRLRGGYREQALKRIDEIFHDLRAKITGLKDGQTIAVVGLQFGLNVPQSHEKAYDQIIRMMEMSVDDEITLTCSQFACFVMDDWDWKEQWSASNATYLKQ